MIYYKCEEQVKIASTKNRGTLVTPEDDQMLNNVYPADQLPDFCFGARVWPQHILLEQGLQQHILMRILTWILMSLQFLKRLQLLRDFCNMYWVKFDYFLSSKVSFSLNSRASLSSSSRLWMINNVSSRLSMFRLLDLHHIYFSRLIVSITLYFAQTLLHYHHFVMTL